VPDNGVVAVVVVGAGKVLPGYPDTLPKEPGSGHFLGAWEVNLDSREDSFQVFSVQAIFS
jgi:hypothetical protein